LLEKNTEKDQSSVQVTYKGQIYDLSASKLWKGGRHMNRHSAGEDLTDFMSMAPHGPEVLEKFPVLGPAKAASPANSGERYRILYNKYHPHPILLHYPMGVLPFGALLLLLYLATGTAALESAAYYALIFGTIFLYPVFASGILSWCINYQRMLTRIFTLKLTFSIVAIVLSTVAIFLRPASGDFALQGMGLFYCLTYFAAIPCLFVVAYNGGKITWPN